MTGPLPPPASPRRTPPRRHSTVASPHGTLVLCLAGGVGLPLALGGLAERALLQPSERLHPVGGHLGEDGVDPLLLGALALNLLLGPAGGPAARLLALGGDRLVGGAVDPLVFLETVWPFGDQHLP